MAAETYPLTWPAGWKRTPAHERKRAGFGKGEYVAYQGGGGYTSKRELTIADGVGRCLAELGRMGVRGEKVIVSTNVKTSSQGLPLSKSRVPEDPGAAVYWNDGKRDRVMAIDRYTRLADNLGAIAATLEAMRAIERHGGAEILDRAFTGFAALPAPGAITVPWRQVLGIDQAVAVTADLLESRYRTLRSAHHPDKGGSAETFHAVQTAYDQGRQEIGA